MARWNFALLEAKRTEQGYTLEQIAEATGMSIMTVGRYVRGFVTRPDMDKLAAIAKVLGLRLEELLISEDDLGEAVRPYVEEVAG